MAIKRTLSMKHRLYSLFIILGIALPQANADLTVAAPLSSNMVLQRGQDVPVWGKGVDGETVSVSFNGQTENTTVSGGKWRVDLAPMTVNSSGQSLTVTGPSNVVTLTNVLIGDVWLAAGQSNMKYRLNQMPGYYDTVSSPTYAEDQGVPGTMAYEFEAIKTVADSTSVIRYLKVPIAMEATPQDEFLTESHWEVSSSSQVDGLSAIAVIFSQRVQSAISVAESTDVPVGVIISAEGSTPAECWVSDATNATAPFAATQAFWDAYLVDWESVKKPALLETKLTTHLADPTDSSKAAAYDLNHPSTTRIYPTAAYNGMLAPLLPFSLKGVIWRQGEANSGRSVQYYDLMTALIAEWRSDFESADLPFIQVMAPEQGVIDTSNGASGYAELRETQARLAEDLSGVELAVVIDGNDDLIRSTGKANVHPYNKQLDGERVSLVVLEEVYGVVSGYRAPKYSSMVVENTDDIRISLTDATGLIIGNRASYISLDVVAAAADPIVGFSIAGADQVFHAATATLDGTDIIVSSASVAAPVAVRYAWADNPSATNVYNAAGLPLAPFRTDTWTLSSVGNVEPKISYFVYKKGKVLEVAVTGSGQVQAVPDTSEDYYVSGDYTVYPANTSVELTAVADNASWVFASWSGDATGVGSVTDVLMSDNRSVTATFSANAENVPPTFDAELMYEVDGLEGVSYSGTLADHVTDLNLDTLSFTLLSGPSWLSISSSGELSGMPAIGQSGLNVWTVQVDDGHGGQSVMTLKMTVRPEGSVTGTPQMIGYGQPGIDGGPVVWDVGVDGPDVKITYFGTVTYNGVISEAQVAGDLENMPAGAQLVDDATSGSGTGLTLTLVNVSGGDAKTNTNKSGSTLAVMGGASSNLIETNESITFTLNQDVSLQYLRVFNPGTYGVSGTVGRVAIDGGATIDFPITDEYVVLPADTILWAGQTLTFSTPASENTGVSGAGWNLRGLVVNRIPTPTTITPVARIEAGESGTHLLEWPGMIGRNYHVLASTDLITWSPYSSDVAGAEPFTRVTITTDLERVFFLIEMDE